MAAISKDEFVRFLIEEKALRFGTFTLKAGGRSPFFINLGDICSGSALKFAGQALAINIKENFGGADLLFGPPYKGITLVAATAIAYQELFGQQIYTCYNRKEAKQHGEKGMFVGREPEAGDRIVVIDDVLTTGGTKVEAIRLLESAFKAHIKGICVTVDRRLEDAGQHLDGYPVCSVIRLDDIIAYLRSVNDPNADVMQQFYEGRYE